MHREKQISINNFFRVSYLLPKPYPISDVRSIFNEINQKSLHYIIIIEKIV